MAYESYERATDGVLRSVEVWTRHLTDGGTYSATGTPALADVERYLDQTYYQLQGVLARIGYSTAISGTPALGILENLQAVGAVVAIELAHPVTGLRGEGNDRYKEFQKKWDKGTAELASDMLEQLGETRTTRLSAYIEVGGVSRSRKQNVPDDADAIQPRFRRGQFANPRVSRATPHADSDSFRSDG